MRARRAGSFRQAPSRKATRCSGRAWATAAALVRQPCRGDRLGLGGRDDRVVEALEQQHGAGQLVDVTDRRTLEFSYADRDSFAFIDPNTFDQIELSAQTLGDVKNFLTPGGKVDVLFVDDKALTVELPSTVTLKIIESPEGIRGDTTSNVQKPATLETGLVIQVPLFVKEGELVRVSTADGAYMGRA